MKRNWLRTWARIKKNGRVTTVKTRSIRYLDRGGLEIVELDVPDPGPGEVQVKAAACGICKWDIGTYKTGAADRWAAPAGHEGLGYIHKVGPGVDGLKEGARVANGSFAGYMNIPANGIHVIPPSDLPDEHWIVEPVSCIVTGLDTARLMPGDRIAVIGCGLMGLMFVQALARSYFEQVIAFDIDEKKLALARTFGATSVFDPAVDGFGETIKELRALQIDKVFDCSGTKEGLDLAANLVKTGGLISLFGWIRGEVSIPGSNWHMGGFTVVNASPFADVRDPFPIAIRLIQKGVIDLKSLVTDVVTLDEYASLLDEVIAGRERTYVKGVVKLDC